LRVGLIALGTLVALLVVALAAAIFLVDPNSFKPRIVAEVKRATGRDIVIAGRVSLEPTYPLTVSIEGVSVANIAGGSRPQMATVRRVEAQIDALPLLARHVAIERLVLMQPDILLETTAQGEPNWRFAPPAPPPGGGAAPADPSAAKLPGRVSIQAVHVRDAVLTWREGRTQRGVRLELQKLDGTAPSSAAQLALTGEGKLEGVPFTMTAQTGPLTRLLDRAATTPWPLQAVLLSATAPGAPPSAAGAPMGGARLAITGSVADPIAFRGYSLTLDAAAADLSTMMRGGKSLPPLRNVTLSGKVVDSGGGVPDFSQVKLQAGPSDLSDEVPGLLLDRTELTIPGPNEKMHAEMHGTLSGTPLDIVATLGAPRLLLAGRTGQAGAAFPVDLDLDVAGVKLTAKGGIASPTTLTGLDVAVQANSADLRTLVPLVGRRLPTLRDIAFSGRIADGPGGYTKAIVLNGASLTLPQGDITGDATLTFGARPRLQATLVSKLIDVDALLASVPAAEPTAAGLPTPPPAPGAPGAAEPAAPARRVFSDRPFPLEALGLADADLALTLGEVRSQGVVYRDIAGHAVLQGGKLTLDPFAGQTPSGRLEATLGIDTTQPGPPVALTLRAPGLAIKPVLGLFGLPDDMTGLVEIDADLHGAGNTPHALMAGVDGRLGFAMVDGDIENRTLVGLVGDVLRAARLPVDLGGAGRTKLRCLAVRLDATHGTAAIAALVLDSTRLLLQGSGSISLGDEALALRLRPVLRLGAGPGLAVPVRLGGTLRDPKAAIDVGGALETNLANAAGLQGGRAGVSPSGADRNGDLCPGALTAARNGRAGPMPGAAPGSATPAAPAGRINPADLLRGLVR
jgi:AsmA protein